MKLLNVKLKILPYILCITTLILIANSASHPINVNGGYTGAPLDSSCNSCHRSQNQNLSGDLDIKGIPPIVFVGETYPLEISLTNPDSDGVRGGFQLVALEADLANAGEFDVIGENIINKIASGKSYLGHGPSVNFEGGVASWKASWTILDNDDGILTFYGVGMIGNGASGNSGDRAIYKQWTSEVKDSSEAVFVSFIDSTLFFCEGTEITLKPNIYGGRPPYTLNWDNGQIEDSIIVSNPGVYRVTLTDENLNTYTDSVMLIHHDTTEIVFSVESASSTTAMDGSILIEPEKEIFDIELRDSNNTVISENLFSENLSSGPYTLSFSNTNGCHQEYSIVIPFSTTTHNPLNYEIKIFPTVVNEELNISTEKNNFRYVIYNYNGQAMDTGLIQNGTLSVSHLNQGLYLFQVLDNNKRKINFRFVKR